jgi:hypothetical protein
MTVDLDAAELAEPVRTAENTALVLIDFQRDFCEAGGYADTIDDIGFAREVVPRALRLLHAAREHSLTIVHTREGYAPDLSDCSLQRRLRSARVGAPIGSVGPLGRLLIRGEFGHDFISELTPEESELVIDNPSYGASTHTSLGAGSAPPRHRPPLLRRCHRRRVRAHDCARGDRPWILLPLRPRCDLYLRSSAAGRLRADGRRRGRHLGSADRCPRGAG